MSARTYLSRQLLLSGYLLAFPLFLSAQLSDLPFRIAQIVSEPEWEALSEQQRTNLSTYAETAERHPELLLELSAPCFHEESDPVVADIAVEIVSGLREQVRSELDQEARYSIQNGAWSTTATNGPGIVRGDPITLTWSYLPDSTTINSNCLSWSPAPSDLLSFLTTLWGSGPTDPDDLTTAPWHPLFVEAFDRWSEQTGITFVYEPSDDGSSLTYSAQGQLGIRGDIRLGGRPVDNYGGVLACAYYPVYGDVIFDTSDGYYTTHFGGPGGSDVLLNIITHELGHALGIRHVCPVDQTKLMEPYISGAYRGPQFSELLAISRGYGDRLEGNDDAVTAPDLGTLDPITPLQLDTLGIDGANDSDCFRFTLGGTTDQDLTVTLNPIGELYSYSPLSGSSCGSATTSYHSQEVLDLQIELLDATGSTLLATAAITAAGDTELLSGSYPPGEYVLRISQEPDPDGAALTDDLQLYNLSLQNALVLPVEWVDFTARTFAPQETLLEWTTAREWNSSYFSVERSSDGVHFEAIARLSAAGWSEEMRSYRFVDAAAPVGVSYYRLQQVDLDGSSQYSSVVFAKHAAAPPELQAFPSPAEDHLLLRSGDSELPLLLLRTYDGSGQELFPVARSSGGGLRLEVAGWPTGIYTCQVQVGSRVEVIRWVHR